MQFVIWIKLSEKRKSFSSFFLRFFPEKNLVFSQGQEFLERDICFD